MNEDFDKHHPIDTELQVRLMNLALGEASDFERDQLQLLMEQRPELAAYYRHIEHLHGLLGEVGAGDPLAISEASMSDQEWRLPADKREQLLAFLDGTQTATTKIVSSASLSKSRLIGSKWLVSAAVVASIVLVLVGLMLPAVQSAREASRRIGIAGGTPETNYMMDDVPFYRAEATPVPQEEMHNRELFRSLSQALNGEAEVEEAVLKQQIDRFDDSLQSQVRGEPSRAKEWSYGTNGANANPIPGLQTPKPSGAQWDVELKPDAPPPPSRAAELPAASPVDAKKQSGTSDESGRATVQLGGIKRPIVPELEKTLGENGRQSGAVAGRTLETPRIMVEEQNEADPSYSYFGTRISEDVRSLTPSQEIAPNLWAEPNAPNEMGDRAKLKDVSDEESPVAAEALAQRDYVEAIGEVDAAAMGDVQPEYIEELDMVIIKGARRDVERTLGIIAEGKATVAGKATNRNRLSDGQQSLEEQSTSNEPLSTFSLHVSDVSFKLAQSALAQGQWPAADKIRIEEFVNALDYRDPLPVADQKVACAIDQAIHPFLMQRNLLRIAMRTAAAGRSPATPLRLTMLLDNSGSMERPDRRETVVRAFQTLCAQLSAADQVTLISFASQPRLLADKVAGNQGESLVKLIENLPSEGGTNIEAALLLAREKALEQKLPGAQNRIVLLTDGAVNLGNANPESLSKLVMALRDEGIAFDAAGISAQDLNDDVLEALTRQGDGRYYLLDSAETVSESFSKQIAGALRPSAQNVKVQVEFNPDRVARYKLLGFEKHRLNAEDFRNDKVDAAEMAAAEAGVAVYHYELNPNGHGDIGSVSVRFRDISSGQMIERRWPIPYDSSTPRLESSAPSIQLATCSALFAAKLSGGALGERVDLAQLQKVLANIQDHYATQPRVAQLQTMINQAIAIKN